MCYIETRPKFQLVREKNPIVWQQQWSVSSRLAGSESVSERGKSKENEQLVSFQRGGSLPFGGVWFRVCG